MAVFSIGLVLFMALTGQLKRFFLEDDPFPQQETSLPEGSKNKFTLNWDDPKHQRSRLGVRGILSDNQSLKIEDSINPVPIELKDAVITIPLYDDTTSKTATRRFDIQAKRMRGDPETSEIKLWDGIVATGSDRSRIETDSVTINYLEEDNLVRVVSEKPFRSSIAGSAEMVGESGFEGEIVDDQGLRVLRLKPPVVVAIDRERGREFLGMTTDTSDEVTESERIILIGTGDTQLIRGVPSESTQLDVVKFTGGVSVFVAPSSTPIHPRPDVPPEHFWCEDLDLVVDAASYQVEEMKARGPNKPVQFAFLVEPQKTGRPQIFRAEGSELYWNKNNALAHWGSGGAVISGPPCRIRANEAVFNTEDRVCEFGGGITGVIDLSKLAIKTHDDPTLWKRSLSIQADRGSLTLDPAEDDSYLILESEPGQNLSISDISGAGITVEGRRLAMSHDQTRLSLSGQPAQLFDSNNRIESKTIDYLTLTGEFLFAGGVNANIADYSPYVRKDGKDESNEPEIAQITLKAAQATLEWNSEAEAFERVEADGLGKVLDFNYELPNLQVTGRGHHLTWLLSEERLIFRGPHLQEVVVAGDQPTPLSFSAHEIAMNLGEWISELSGSARILFNADLSGDGLLEPCEFTADELQAKFRRVPEDPDDSPKSGPSSVRNTPFELVHAHASANEVNPLRFRSTTFEVGGTDLEVNQIDRSLVLQGQGRQWLYYELSGNQYQATAERITVRGEPPNYTAKLSGNAEILLEISRAPSKQSISGPWTFKTDEVVATFSQSSSGALLKSVSIARSFSGENRDQTVTLAGHGMRWTADQRRLVMGGGDQLQTLTRIHRERRDEIVCRSIDLVESPNFGLVSYCRDVLRATFHHFEEGTSSRFRVRSDHLLLTAKRVEDQFDLNEVSFWDRVSFDGDDLQVLADRALYEHQKSQITFAGDPQNPPQILKGAAPEKVGNPIRILRRGGRYEIELPRGFYGMERERLESLLELFKEDSRGKKSDR